MPAIQAGDLAEEFLQADRTVGIDVVEGQRHAFDRRIIAP
jgi:hypothetical protein